MVNHEKLCRKASLQDFIYKTASLFDTAFFIWDLEFRVWDVRLKITAGKELFFALKIIQIQENSKIIFCSSPNHSQPVCPGVISKKFYHSGKQSPGNPYQW